MTTHRFRHAGMIAVTALAMSLAAGCSTDEVLRVNDPDVVRPEGLDDVANLPVYLASAYAEVMGGYDGGVYEGIVNYAGLFSDEFIQTESFPTRFEVDTRNMLVGNSSLVNIFRELSRGRAAAERAARKYVELGQPNAVGRAEALMLAGFTYILFGENYCSGVPFSTLNDDQTIVYGSPQTTQQMFEIALAKFDTAITVAGALSTAKAQSVVNAARVGRGRALINLARYADAATAVAGVPAEFKFELQHSDNSARQNNGVWALSINGGRWGVAEREGGNGLPFRTAADARVASRPRSSNSGNGFDGGPMFEALKYPARTTAVILADGVEAELIKAEAQLRAGNASGFLATLNALRANAAVATARGYAGTFAAVTDPGTDAARQDLLFRERAYWLFLTAHRVGDMRRLIRQYGRGAETVFPTGSYSSNGRSTIYGTDTSFPIPIEELNNPDVPDDGPTNLKGCLNRNA
ncbi:MAG TPA: RagB/SusD family nutrient uptake outer membrane protein [Gemmatimonadaceae bacterium]|nr:RagB/SusD family nutrient uptake outer membrane protein [Gemmatimonadaceae bacterium]